LVKTAEDLRKWAILAWHGISLKISGIETTKSIGTTLTIQSIGNKKENK
jgi:hypothetical protein